MRIVEPPERMPDSRENSTSNEMFCVLNKGRTFVETENLCDSLGAEMPIIKSKSDQYFFNNPRTVS